MKEVENLVTFYCNWYVEKMAQNFTLQDDENCYIFVTKDKRQTIILTMSYIENLQVLTAKAVWNFLSLIVIFKLLERLKDIPYGHIFVDSPLIRRRNSTCKVCGNYIDFERRIHVEIMTWIWRRYFDVNSTFKIDKISMSTPRGFFYVVSTSNQHNFFTRFFHSIIF